MNELEELSMSQGHLNYPERIHEKEGFGTDIDWLRWYYNYNNGIILRDPRREIARAELRGLTEYSKLIMKDFIATGRIEKEKPVKPSLLKSVFKLIKTI